MDHTPCCFDCDNRECFQRGYDSWPLEYCVKQPVIDRFEYATEKIFSLKCRKCRHRLHQYPDIESGPCRVCIHAKDADK